MANLDLIKENIEVQIQIGVNSNDDVLRDEYLISDTLPDVKEILSVDVEEKVTKAEVLDGKVAVEADVRYTVVYLSDEEEGSGVNNVVYKSKLSNFIDISNAEQGMLCNVECELEHINPTLVNERKINVEAYFRLKAKVYKHEEFEFVESVENRQDIQVIKKVENIDKTIYSGVKAVTANQELRINMDKAQIEKVVKFDSLIHKKEVKLYDNKIQYSCYAKVNIVYRTEDSRELSIVEDDVFISSEEEIVGVSPNYECDYDFRVINADYAIGQDDLGENRIINLGFNLEVDTKVYKSDVVEIIEDAYSPNNEIRIIKDSIELNIRHAVANSEAIIKENFSLDNEEAVQIISVRGVIDSVKHEAIGELLNIEGNLKVKCIYKNANSDKIYNSKEFDIPFTTNIEIPKMTDNMDIDIKSSLECMQASIEAGTIAIKGIALFTAKTMYKEKKGYITAIEDDDDAEVPVKKASVIIYVVQAGDTIWKLAKKYKTTMQNIADINNIDLNDTLEIGDKLIIPGRAVI
ncbi:MAG: SPOCS domain-containing protein [Sarcina sp.]